MKKKEWNEYKAAQPLSMFHGSSPQKEDLELGVRLVCAGKLTTNRESATLFSRAANEVAQVFAEKHAKYYSHRLGNWRKGIESNRGVLGCCSRAAAQADMLNISISDYLEAQFWFFDEAFSRAPTYAEIAAVGCLSRYKKWAVGRAHKGIAPTTVRKSTGGVVFTTKTKAEIIKAYEEKVLARMIKQWGTEERVWELCGDFDDEEVFSNEFKRSRPLWREMYDEE